MFSRQHHLATRVMRVQEGYWELNFFQLEKSSAAQGGEVLAAIPILAPGKHATVEHHMPRDGER